MRTHDVTNTVPDFVGQDLFGSDAVLTESLDRWGRAADAAELSALGRRANSVVTLDLADRAERHSPVLRTHDRRGERIDDAFGRRCHGFP